MTRADRLVEIKMLVVKIIERDLPEMPDRWQHIRIDLWARGERRTGKAGLETHEADVI